MDERRDSFPPAVGGSSLLVIFAVLCLTVFALLGLATVQANSRLSDASAQTVSGYYAADCQAETILAPRALCQKLTPDYMGSHFARAIQSSPSATAVWRIDMDQITGKEKAMRG